MQLPGVGSNAKKHVTFDEHQIQEHDKERGTRMSIPDPDTPFMRSPIMSDDEHEEDKIPDVVNPHSMMSDAVSAGIMSPSANSDASTPRSSNSEFKERRKAFYNEFRVLKGLEKPSNQMTSDDTDGTL